jgi:hypothetical protein
MNFFPEFKWAVLHAFSNALAVCRFEQGDVFYDTQLAYKDTWAEAEKHVNYSIQVKSPMRGSSTEVTSNVESIFSANWASRVVFEFCDHREKTKKIIETTQGRLYSLLWHGDVNNYLSDSIEMPKQALSLLDVLENIAPVIQSNFMGSLELGSIFLLPFDFSSQQLKDKNQQLKAHLSPHLIDHKLIALKDTNFSDALSFVPTAEISAFLISKNLQDNGVKEMIKKSLYKPAKDKKSTKEIFSISNHGFLKFI